MQVTKRLHLQRLSFSVSEGGLERAEGLSILSAAEQHHLTHLFDSSHLCVCVSNEAKERIIALGAGVNVLANCAPNVVRAVLEHFLRRYAEVQNAVLGNFVNSSYFIGEWSWKRVSGGLGDERMTPRCYQVHITNPTGDHHKKWCDYDNDGYRNDPGDAHSLVDRVKNAK